jgi:hypothetical protein
MTNWMTASAPLVVAAAAAAMHFAGVFGEAPFRALFLLCSAAWFVLAYRAQRNNKSR